MDYKLLQIDELTIDDHSYLSVDEDSCFYLMEYTARKGHSFNSANSTIFNFKKSVEKRELPEYKYKLRTIRNVANYFKTNFSKQFLKKWTFVPMPPSKCKDDELYDDRVVQLVNMICEDVDSDIRELIYLDENMPASHGSENRLSVEEIYEYFRINKKLVKPLPKRIIIVDDVITAGAHFKAAKRILLETFPNIEEVRGIFVARRVFLPDLLTDEL